MHIWIRCLSENSCVLSDDKGDMQRIAGVKLARNS